MGKGKNLIAGLLLALTIPTTVAGVTFTIQNPSIVKDWIKGEQVTTSTEDQKEIDELKAEIDMYKELLAEAEGDKDKIASLEAQIEEHKATISNLEKQLEEAKGNEALIEDLQQQINQQETIISELQSQLESAQEDKALITQLQQKITELENKVAELEEQLQSQGSQENKEITLFNFSNGQIDKYSGTETTLQDIPTSYSIEFTPTEDEVTINSGEELNIYFESVSSKGYDSFSYFKIEINSETLYLNMISLMYYLTENEMSDLPVSTKIQLGDIKFFEGNGYQVDSIGAFVFEGSNVNKLILPEHITNVDISIFDEIDELVINNESMISFIDIQGRGDVGNTKIYVQSNLLESYKTKYPKLASKFFDLNTNETEKTEIIDFKFSANSMVAYSGDSEIVENIPTSYSMEFTPSSEEIDVISGSELETIFNDSFDFTSYLKVTFNDNTCEYYDVNSFTYMLEEKAESVLPFKVQVGQASFYTGDDYKVNKVSGFAFDNTNAKTVILPKEITSFDLSNFSNIKTLIVANEEVVIDGPDYNNSNVPYKDFEMIVPDSLYEEYLSDAIWSNYSKNILKSSLNKSAVTNFNDYVFVNDTISGYQGTDVVIKLPSTYNKEEIIYETIEGQNDNASELEEEWGSNKWYVSFNGNEKKLMDYSDFAFQCMAFIMISNQYSYTIEKVRVNYFEGSDYNSTCVNATTFENDNLVKIIIPSTYTEVDCSAFSNIQSLRVIEIENKLGQISLINTDLLSENIIIKYVG